MKRHALFVGVNAYDDKTIRPLRYSIPDASVLADRFKGFGYSTRLLADPTGAELKAAVMESTEGLGSGDVFLFFFAGHGFTSQDGAHLLFCRDDMQRLLRVNAAGIRVDAIEALTSDGGFHRAFLLDSCRTDCFAAMECRGGGTARDLDFVSMPECTKASGSFYLLRSCDKFRPSLEFDAIGHGLFTQGLLDAMDARDNRLVYCDTSFATAVGGMMEGLQRVHHVTDLQRPSIGEVSGPAFSLFDDDFILPTMRTNTSPSTEIVLPPSATQSSALTSCPVCGRNNSPANTFNCIVCGRKNICVSHFFAEYNCCEACAEKKINTMKALKAYNDNDYDLAYELMQKGDDTCPEGQYVIAGLYEVGCRYFDEDSDKAAEWFRKAAEQGYADAQFKLADYYSCGCSVEENPSGAYNWYLKAARQGHVEAQYFVGRCFETGLGVEEDADSAFLWYQRAAEQGWASAQCSLGRLYANGEGTEEDAEEAVKWYRKAAEQGDDEAQYYLGECYYRGDGVEESEDEAIKWYRLAADQGNEDAQERLDELDQQKTEDDEAADESDGEERAVERNEADSNKRKTIPLPQHLVNLVEGGVSGGDRFGRYCGPMENGKPHGTGRFMSSSGYVYTGVFFNGVRSGRGKIEYKDGATYEGGFYEGEWSGEGTYTWPNGTQHVGQFRNGKFHGPGRQINPDGTSFTGNWEYGKLIAYT